MTVKFGHKNNNLLRADRLFMFFPKKYNIWVSVKSYAKGQRARLCKHFSKNTLLKLVSSDIFEKIKTGRIN